MLRDSVASKMTVNTLLEACGSHLKIKKVKLPLKHCSLLPSLLKIRKSEEEISVSTVKANTGAMSAKSMPLWQQEKKK